MKEKENSWELKILNWRTVVYEAQHNHEDPRDSMDDQKTRYVK